MLEESQFDTDVFFELEACMDPEQLQFYFPECFGVTTVFEEELLFEVPECLGVLTEALRDDSDKRCLSRVAPFVDFHIAVPECSGMLTEVPIACAISGASGAGAQLGMQRGHDRCDEFLPSEGLVEVLPAVEFVYPALGATLLAVLLSLSLEQGDDCRALLAGSALPAVVELRRVFDRGRRAFLRVAARGHWCGGRRALLRPLQRQRRGVRRPVLRDPFFERRLVDIVAGGSVVACCSTSSSTSQGVRGMLTEVPQAPPPQGICLGGSAVADRTSPQESLGGSSCLGDAARLVVGAAELASALLAGRPAFSCEQCEVLLRIPEGAAADEAAEVRRIVEPGGGCTRSVRPQPPRRRRLSRRERRRRRRGVRAGRCLGYLGSFRRFRRCVPLTALRRCGVGGRAAAGEDPLC